MSKQTGYLSRASSGSLIYAIDPDHIGQLEGNYTIEEAESSILNIITANRFDSIPLVAEFGGEITRVARKQFHDGDADGLTIVPLEEVGFFPENGDLLQAIIEVLGNEHHIVLVGESREKATSVISIDMLSSNLVRQYLSSKISELAHDKGLQGLDAGLGLEIHEKIKKLRDLIEDDYLHTDEDITKAIVDTLIPLQQIKTGTECEIDKTFLEIREAELMPDSFDDLRVKHVAKWPMAGINISKNQRENDLAAMMLFVANDWDIAILGFEENDTVIKISLDENNNNLVCYDKRTQIIDYEAHLESHIYDISKNGFSASVNRISENFVEYGIITSLELSSDFVKGFICKKIIQFDLRLKKALKEMGVTNITRNRRKKSINKATFGELLSHNKFLKIGLFENIINQSDDSKHSDRGKLNKFRADLFHKLLGEDNSILELDKIEILFEADRKFSEWEKNNFQ
jgi:hypothetical protein